MAQCEDYPCCGHAGGGCPRRDDNGRILCEEDGCTRQPVRFGLCRNHAAQYQRQAGMNRFDLTGQDDEAGY